MSRRKAVALDIGNKRIGVAVTDPFNEYAMPCDTYFRTKNVRVDAEALAKLATAKGAQVIVCGMPVNFDGSESVQTVKTREFIGVLKEYATVPIELADERFTTMQARETQMLGGVKRENRKNTVDSIAASYILEGWLATEKNRENKENKIMKEELQEELFDEEERIIELEDEDGNTEKFLHIGTIEYKGEWFCFFQKAEPETEEEEDEVVIFRLEGEEGDKRLCIIEDEQLMDEVFAEFCNQYEDFEDADEAMKLDS